MLVGELSLHSTNQATEELHAHLFPNVIKQPSQQHLLTRQNIRGVSLVHPVAYQLLERCLLRHILCQNHWTPSSEVIRDGKVVVVWGISGAINERGTCDW